MYTVEVYRRDAWQNLTLMHAQRCETWGLVMEYLAGFLPRPYHTIHIVCRTSAPGDE